MKISEVSPDFRNDAAADSKSHRHLLDDLESSIKSAETLSPSSLPALPAALRRSLSLLSSFPSLPDSSKLLLWKLSYRLWNACVDLSNSADLRSPVLLSSDHAELRQIAADLLILAGNPAGIPTPELKSASFFLKTGLIWHDLRRFDLAANCFEKATDLLSSVKTDGEEERKLVLDLNLARSRTAFEVDDRNLAIALLNRSKNLIAGSPAGFKAVAEQYLHFGKQDLAKKSPDGVKFLTEALDLCEKGILAGNGKNTTPTLVGDLEALKNRCLRFLAAERLQSKDFEGVLRCIRVLRRESKGREEEKEHPSVGFVAMKAWLGLGRESEAEKELKGMMENEGLAENVLVSAAEEYLAAAGAGAAKGVMAGLVGRCRNGGTAAAVRVLRRVAESGGGVGGGGGRAKVVAELAADERVVGLFDGGSVGKERSAMHALLWNCGAEHFRLKEYEISAEMFEKSMLYLPRDEENRNRRSNCFRVLSLCYLALAQLDRAEEFINQADKLEPNIKCAFLKFKIQLQKKEEKEAVNQIQAMVSCIDFNPEYLTLSAHEAIACQSLLVAIASLSVLLSLYSPGKSMPMPEVAVLRNLIALLHRNPDTKIEILRYLKHAQAQTVQLGSEAFFGRGAVGSRELNWFAGTAWNMGLKTGEEKKYELCAEFFELASDFYSKISDATDETHVMICKALIVSVGAMINAEEEKRVTMSDSDIKKALEMLGRAGKILPSFCCSDQSMDALFFFHTFNTYRLLNRLNDTQAQQLQLIKTLTSKPCNPQNLLQLGLVAARGTRPNPEAAELTLNACLSSLLASPLPDYQMVGTVLRRLVGLAGLRGINDEKDGPYSVYRQAFQIIVGLKEGEFPTEEGKWLAMTAWNRAGMFVRLRQVEAARKWMKMGLDLARHLQGMEKYIKGMEECFASFENISGGRDGRATDSLVM